MIFLIEYDRQKGRMVTFKKFRDTSRLKAQKERLELELDLNRKNIKHEIVLLEAARESQLRRTHRRYFETLNQIAKSMGR